MTKRSKLPLNVPAFGYTFLLLNRFTGLWYSFDTVSEAMRFARPSNVSDASLLFSSSSALLSEDEKLSNHLSTTPRYPMFFLSNHLGVPVPFAIIEEEFLRWKKVVYRYNRKKTSAHVRQDMLDQRLVKTKHSTHKIKSNYQKTWSSSWFDSEQILQNNQVGMYRHVKTRFERRWNKAHSDKEMQQEGALGVVRPSRNRLPTYWDDTCVSMHHGEKSWKHHSKRKRQYKPK